ncbi:(2Fe-2S)-binding protein [Neisseriaceae bacterium TC5R-5]|nr:(2Fe-2S)-binding protein [Neisseriaceae bacterium TC5R-5]
MPTIRFVDQQQQLLCEQQAATGDNLLDVARLADVPLHWRCGQGTCGTCKVRVSGAQTLIQQVGRKERNVLLRAGVISAELAANELWQLDQPWRLACHLKIGEEDWLVECPSF